MAAVTSCDDVHNERVCYNIRCHPVSHAIKFAKIKRYRFTKIVNTLTYDHQDQSKVRP